MKFGVNTFVWVSPCTTEAVKDLAPRVRSMGFDILELAVENPGLIEWAGSSMLTADPPLANPDDMTIPHCVANADEAIALIGDHHGAPLRRGHG